MNKDVILRSAIIADSKQICKVVEITFMENVAPNYSPEGIKFFNDLIRIEYFQEKINIGNPIFVAEKRNEIIGVIEIRENCHIARFFVLPGYQKEGIGRALYKMAKKECIKRNKNLSQITVNASPNAKPAYQKLGFIETGKEEEANGMKYIPMKAKMGQQLAQPMTVPRPLSN